MVCPKGDTRLYSATLGAHDTTRQFLVRDGQILKVHTQVQVDEFVWIPFFIHFQVRPIKYERIAVICHHGDHPRSGHYQAILHSGSSCWNCDDNRGSHSCADAPTWYTSCCYLLMYKRASDLTPEIIEDTVDHTRFPIRHA